MRSLRARALKQPLRVRGRPARVCSLDIWKNENVLRRSKIFIVIGIQIAVSSVGAAYYGRHPGRKISVRFPTPIHS